MAAAREQIGLAAELAHQLLRARRVDAEGAGGDEDAGAFGLQRGDGLAHLGRRHGVEHEEAVGGRQHATGRQLDGLDADLGFGELGGVGARHADDADGRYIAFQQRVGGLRGAVGEEDHLVGRDARLRQHVAEHLDHAGRDAARVVVRGEDGVAADHGVGAVFNQHGLGERAADIDADAIGARRGCPVRHRAIARTGAEGSELRCQS